MRISAAISITKRSRQDGDRGRAGGRGSLPARRDSTNLIAMIQVKAKEKLLLKDQLYALLKKAAAQA
jgi:hypothetical protein